MTRLWRLRLAQRKHRRRSRRRRGDDETSMKNWCSMTCRHPGKLLEQALQQWDHRYRRTPGCTDGQADRKTLRACQNTPQAAGDLTKENCVEHCGGTRQTNVLGCKAIADYTDKQKVRVTRHCQTLAGNGIVVSRACSTARKSTVAGAGSTAGVDG